MRSGFTKERSREECVAVDDRKLFEQAVAELDGKTPSRIKRMKSGGNPKAARRSAGVRRLDKRRRSVVPDFTIDLHGLEAKPALARLRRFLVEHRRADLVLVVHGKGKGVLRDRVVGFLDMAPGIIEHLEAPPRLGGGGARLVRMRS